MLARGGPVLHALLGRDCGDIDEVRPGDGDRESQLGRDREEDDGDRGEDGAGFRQRTRHAVNLSRGPEPLLQAARLRDPLGITRVA